ncbi:hypothetical protein HMPREF9056_00967 [Actinomyces sp. oral taxon 170 str. F0386]|nr:hypothetical protein HMPREF9056_00967 [Actinomyces sp. oral taxon 170 str. F0386]
MVNTDHINTTTHDILAALAAMKASKWSSRLTEMFTDTPMSYQLLVST